VKKQLRQQIRERLAAIRPADMQARSAAACALLCETEEYRRADVVMIFLSTVHEVDTAPIAIQAWRDGKRILAPRVSWEQRRMLPVEIQSLTTDVAPGQMGIREPTEGLPVPVLDIDLVVVPGLAFDERGNRLGRGRGFYDRFLSHRDLRAVSCAIAFEEQVVPEVPFGEHDKRVQMIVTDTRVRRFG
jgi:5-formyltetrahydrofolate cyclo-ligase